MKIKAEWLPYLHKLRKKELDIIFQRCPQEKIFETAMEMGAGDGFQSHILSRYAKLLISTDYNQQRLEKVSTTDIEYRICDAEIIDTYFKEGQFDFISSSNLLEHLPHPGMALKGIHKILKDNGITIHVMPSPFLKLCYILLFYPNFFVTKLDELTIEASTAEFIKAKFSLAKKNIKGGDGVTPEMRMGNNPKSVSQRRYSYFRRLLWPLPHGASESNIKEFFIWRKKRWLREFDQAGFNVIKVIKGPVSSGYGFGFDRIRTFLEKISLSSEYIYVVVKKGKNSDYCNYF